MAAGDIHDDEVATEQAVEQPAAAAPLKTHGTRTSRTWTGVAVGLILGLAVLIFILQNGHRARFSFLGLHWAMPVGVALLLAAVAGGLIVLLVGAARVVQLRLTARRARRRPAEL